MAGVLLIEPDAVMANKIAKYFSALDHKVIWAKEPEHAIALADKECPDIVITDLLLAERSGIEFLYEFRSYPDWKNIPVIILSSVPEHEVNTSGDGYAELFISKFLYKPSATLASLASCVNHALFVRA